MIHDTQNAKNLPKKDGRNMYVNIRTMCSPGYHHVAISVCRGSLMTTQITLLALFVEYSWFIGISKVQPYPYILCPSA